MDLLNADKAKPGEINWGHAVVGSGTHRNPEKFVAAAGINVTQVPFKGTPEVVQAMFSGSVDCYWVPISAGLSPIKGGQLRPPAGGPPAGQAALAPVPTPRGGGRHGAAPAPLCPASWPRGNAARYR